MAWAFIRIGVERRDPDETRRRGFVTLSVQMPVLASGATRDDYRATLPEASQRIAAALRYLREKRVAKNRHRRAQLRRDDGERISCESRALDIDAWVASACSALRREAEGAGARHVASAISTKSRAAATRRRRPPATSVLAPMTIAAPTLLRQSTSRARSGDAEFLERVFAQVLVDCTPGETSRMHLPPQLCCSSSP
jgi:hypothetical protein